MLLSVSFFLLTYCLNRLIFVKTTSMKTILLTCLIVFSYSFTATAEDRIASLIKELDYTIKHDEIYIEQKENRIDRLKEQLSRELSPAKQFEIVYDIVNEYKSYNCDSALTYIDRNMELAEVAKEPVWQIKTRLQYSYVLSSAGLFKESEENLRTLPREYFTNELWIDYYQRMEQLSSLLNEYVDDNRFTVDLRKRLLTYRDSVCMYLPEDSPLYLFYAGQIEQGKGNIDEAYEYISSYLQMIQPDTHEYAKINYHIGNLHFMKGEIEEGVACTIIAALADIKDAVKENRALMDVADWLYEQGDTERAYTYIQYALLDANFYNARTRNFQLSRIVPIISEGYRHRTGTQRSQLIITVTVISLLLIVLLITLFMVQKQMIVLKKIRESLKESNEYLEEKNEELNRVNHELSEANLVKEEYIGHFMNLYSNYITKLEDFRKQIYHKIVARQFDDLVKMTSSNRNKDKETKELYANFDRAFLNIYPGFVSALNALLKEEERFELRKGELLNTELRVFALIRLGITDSGKIADFLRCSLQTVYNYRSKIKRKSLNEEEEIEEQIKKIGMVKQLSFDF